LSGWIGSSDSPFWQLAGPFSFPFHVGTPDKFGTKEEFFFRGPRAISDLQDGDPVVTVHLVGIENDGIFSGG
jgi:hypothetical protein